MQTLLHISCFARSASAPRCRKLQPMSRSAPVVLHYLLASARQSPGRNPLCHPRAKEQVNGQHLNLVSCPRCPAVQSCLPISGAICSFASSRATGRHCPALSRHTGAVVLFYPARLAWRMHFARDSRPSRQAQGEYGTADCLLGLSSFHIMPIFPTATLFHTRTTSTSPT